MGYAVAQLLEALRYKSESRGFYAVIGIFRFFIPPGSSIGLELDSASNRNDYEIYLSGDKGGRCVGLTTLPPSCADCLEIPEASLSWSHNGLSRPVMRYLYL